MNTKSQTTRQLLLAAGMLTASVSAAISAPLAMPAEQTQITAPASQVNATPDGTRKSDVSKVQSDVDSVTADKASEIRDRAIRDAADASHDTEQALRALDARDSQSAIDSIEEAIGKLQSVQAVRPDLAMVPIGVGVQTVDLNADKEEIKDEIKEIQGLLKHNKVQDAREALSLLASETVVTETQLPLGTFPDALIEATKMIREEKLDQAKALILRTLDTVVVVDHVVPLPVVRAEMMLRRASLIAERDEVSEDEAKQFNTLMDNARDQIEVAQLLGYGTKEDFKEVYDQLELIKKQFKNNQSDTGFFKKTAADLKAIREKIFKR